MDPYDVALCDRCWSVAHDVHHIRGRIGKLLNDPKNLVFLCRKCHNRIHAHNTEENKQSLEVLALEKMVLQ